MNEIDPNDIEALKRKLNKDTARINWQALAEHQQQEAVVEVDQSLDLINVAGEFVRDNRDQVKDWLDSLSSRQNRHEPVGPAARQKHQ